MSFLAPTRREKPQQEQKAQERKTVDSGEFDFMTTADVAEILRVSKKHVDYLVHAGKIPYIRISERKVRLERQAFEEWLARNRKGGREHGSTNTATH